MLRTFTIVGLLIAIWLPLIDYGVFRPRRRALPSCANLGRFERLLYLAVIAAVVLMCLSSFGMLAVGQRMHRWALILHMSIAPVFAICLTALALLWAEQSSFAKAVSTRRFYPGEKLAFWITVAMGFVTISTALLGMMTWFGSRGQDALLNIHRISAMVLVIATVFHGARVLACRPVQSAAHEPVHS